MQDLLPKGPFEMLEMTLRHHLKGKSYCNENEKSTVPRSTKLSETFDEMEPKEIWNNIRRTNVCRAKQ